MIGEVRNWEEENIRLLCSTVAPWPDARAKKRTHPSEAGLFVVALASYYGASVATVSLP